MTNPAPLPVVSLVVAPPTLPCRMRLRLAIARRSPRSRRPRGIALILALLVLTLLVVVIGQLAYTTRIDLQVARNSADSQEALHACWGAIEFSKALLRDDVNTNPHDGAADRWARLTQPIQIGDVAVTLRIEDEERKLNLLLLRSPNEPLKTWAQATLRRVVATAREGDQTEGAMPPDQLAENLITWITEGKVPGVSSEDQAFSEAGTTDEIPPLTLAEFLAVEGITRAVLYGPAEPRRAPTEDGVDPYEAAVADQPEASTSLDELLGQAPKKVRGLATFLTLHTDGHININTVDPLLLKAMSQFISDETVEAIVAERQPNGGASGSGSTGPAAAPGAGEGDTYVDKAFTDLAQVREIEGMDDAGDETAWKEMQAVLSVQSQVFKITAQATVTRVRKVVEVIVQREEDGFRVLWYTER